MKSMYQIGAALLAAFALSACDNSSSSNLNNPGSGGPVGMQDPADIQPAATTANHDIFLTDDLSIFDQLTGDVDGFMTFAGGRRNVSATASPQAADKKLGGGDVQAQAAGDRDLAGFVAERPVLQGETSAREVLDQLITDIESGTGYSLSSTGTQTFASIGSVVGRFEVNNLPSPLTPTALMSQIFELVAANVEGGTISGFPAATVDEITADAFNLVFSVVFRSTSDVVILGALVPESVAQVYADVASDATNPTNVGDLGASRVANNEEFTAEGGGGLADFLFVIDNSGSMGDEQVALSDAAQQFSSVITNSGLDFEIGIITTDSDVLRDSNEDGEFTSDVAEFQTDAIPGTNGSGTETGIFFGELSLQSMALGDSSDGTVTLTGHPRSGSSLSVVILSDEPSQYDRRAGSVFDPASNLFIDRAYRVYSITDPADDAQSQYDDLADLSGGSTADITDISTFPGIMTNIATNAGGASSIYGLMFTPIAASISVSDDGVEVPRSNTNGWRYIVSTNSVVFSGNALPEDGSSVTISYVYFDEAMMANGGVVTSIDAKVLAR